MENAQIPDEGQKTVKAPVTKPATSTRKPPVARASQAKSTTAKPTSSAARKPAAKKRAASKTPATKPSAPRTVTPKPTAPKQSVPKPTLPTPDAAPIDNLVSVSSASAESTPEFESAVVTARVSETETPESDGQPDAVLAGLARLRALAAQFTTDAPVVDLVSEPEADNAANTELPLEGEAELSLEDDTDQASAVDLESEAAREVETDPAAVLAPVAVPVQKPKDVPQPAAEPAPDLEPDSEPEPEPELEEEREPEVEPAGDAVVAVRPSFSHALDATSSDIVLKVRGLSKDFGDTVAVNDIDLNVRAGVFYGIVGPNGAGKTTTLSMITGLLRPDSGTARVNGIDVWDSPEIAKRSIGVLPDRLRIFDRLTGSQLLYYSGVLRGLKAAEVRKRSADLATAFRLDDVMGRLVSDYSSGMLKKVSLAAAMIHSPRLLVLDEPFESVDPVSAATVTLILKQYVNAGGTVLLSSHRMELVQRVCSHVAVIVEGSLLADGTIDEVRNGMSLEDRFVQLTGKNSSGGGLEWLNSFSD